MKRILFGIISLVVGTQTLANEYCNHRPSQRDINQCYSSNIQMHNQEMNRLSKLVMDSQKFSNAQKRVFHQDQIEWENRVNSSCRSDECIEQSLIARSKLVAAEYNRAYK